MSLDDLRFCATMALGNPLRPQFAHAIELVETAHAERDFARADNARLVAENARLGEQVTRLIAERDAGGELVAQNRASHCPQCKATWYGENQHTCVVRA